MISVVVNKVKNCYLFSVIWLAGIFYTLASLVNSNLSVAAVDVSPTAPLDGLKTSRQVAQQSNLDVEHVQTTGSNVLGIIMIVGGVLGVLGALIAGWKLYSNIQQGEQARGTNTQYILAVVVAALLSIIAIIVGTITIYATGNQS